MSNYPKTMKALVAYGQTNYRFEKAFPSPECGEDDIIIKVEGCGICAGDLKCRHGAAIFSRGMPVRLSSPAMNFWGPCRADHSLRGVPVLQIGEVRGTGI